MNPRQRLLVLALIMGCACAVVMAVVTAVLYRADLRDHRDALRVAAQSQARLIEAMARHNARVAHLLHDETQEQEALAASLSQLADAHQRYQGFGETGEFTLAHRVGDTIAFVLRHRNRSLDEPAPVPFDSHWAEPMRRALNGLSGTVIGLDYRGKTVLAAHEPVAVLNLGIVVKIDMDEIRAPFIKSVVLAIGVSLLVVLVSTALCYRIGNPMVSRLEAHTRVLRAEVERRRRAEAQRSLLVAAIEQAAESVVITDPDGTIQYVNPGFERVTGYARAEVLGQNTRILKSGVQDRAFYEKLWDTITRCETWTGRFTNKKRDGALFNEVATISPVCDRFGKIVNFVAVKRDVTREVALEEELRQTQKLEAIGQLAGGVAHDFNNLLTAITGYADLVRDELVGNLKALAFLDHVTEAAGQAAGVTRALLTFSRKTEAEKQPIDLSEVIERTNRFLRRVLPASIEWDTDVAGAEPLWVSADGTQLQQVIMNLAVNARDAMPDGGTLRIAASHGTPAVGSAMAEVRLVVSDTGVGMSPEVRERMFEPFFTTKPRGRGTGLGLSIIHGIVKDHGGSIEVKSDPGRGTTFTVTLPGLEAGAVVEIGAPATAALRGRGKLILLAEDDDHVCRVIASSLEALDYEVLQVRDGEALLEAFERNGARVQLIITDMTMPKLSGLTCLREIRAGGATTPVIVITASIDADIEDQLDKHTVLLRKPFQIAALGALVGRLCAAPGAAEQRG